MGHSLLAPSSAARWVFCSGSVRLVQQFPDESGPEAVEGDAAHWVTEQLVTTGWVVPLGHVAPNGAPVIDDMLVGAQLYANATSKRAGGELVTERKVTIHRIHPDCDGTPDGWAWDAASQTLYVYDYKFGRIPVEVELNWQLICYMVGILDQLGAVDLNTRVVFTIVQPRAHHRDGPVRSWMGMASDLRAEINLLIHAAHEALGPNPKCVAGIHCVTTYCPARGSCETFRKVAGGVLAVAGEPGLQGLTPQAAGAELKLLYAAKQMLDGLIDARAAEVDALTKTGQPTGFVLEPKYGRTEWAIPESEIRTMELLFGKELFAPPKPKTPNQAMAALNLSSSAMRTFFRTPSRGFTLTPSDNLDKRAAEAFGASKP